MSSNTTCPDCNTEMNGSPGGPYCQACHNHFDDLVKKWAPKGVCPQCGDGIAYHFAGEGIYCVVPSCTWSYNQLREDDEAHSNGAE